MGGKSQNRSVTAYYRYQSLSDLAGRHARFTGPIRVVVFCLVTVILPCLLLIAPLYIRYHIFRDVAYNLGESDLITVDKPISTFWCEGHELWMNATFHAYLLDEQPEISEDEQLIEMDKHMQLADDSLEYWGFFLLQGSKVIVSVCSRYDGARLMVVKGTKNLKHCALLDPSPNPDQLDPWEDDVSAQGDFKVTFQQGEHDLGEKNQDGEYETPVQPSNGKPVGKSKKTNKNTKKTKDKSPQKGVQTAHESVKVNRHRHRFRKKNATTQNSPPTDGSVSIFNRTRRFLDGESDASAGQNQEYIYDDNEQEEDLEEDHEDTEGEEEDEDNPPNPVGVEPEELEVDNMGRKLDDEETIDEEDIRSSGSSFAKNLWTCYGGDTLFSTQSISASPKCSSQDSMMKHAIRMRTVHEITSTGYYYYIFYSDNDILLNDIFARFNIEKVVYNFPNYTHSCVNTTHCSFPLNFLSSEKVLLEVPLQDGVSDEDALAQMVLISSCRPRLGVYFIFPVSIIFLILCCAFM